MENVGHIEVATGSACARKGNEVPTRKEVIESEVERIAHALGTLASCIDDFAVEHENISKAIEYRKIGIRAREVARDFCQAILDDASMTENPEWWKQDLDGTEKLTD